MQRMQEVLPPALLSKMAADTSTVPFRRRACAVEIDMHFAKPQLLFSLVSLGLERVCFAVLVTGSLTPEKGRCRFRGSIKLNHSHPSRSIHQRDCETVNQVGLGLLQSFEMKKGPSDCKSREREREMLCIGLR